MSLSKARLKQSLKQFVRRVVGEPYVGKRLKLRNIERVFAAIDPHPKTVLDAGAEDATFVYWLADRFPWATVTATDIDKLAIEACRVARPRRYADRVDFRLGTFDTLPTSSFDLVTAFDVLEHIVDDAGAVQQLWQALHPGGSLFVHVPRDQWTHSNGRVERVRDEDAWQINAGHVRAGYSPDALRSLLETAGFQVVDIQIWLRRWGVRAHSLYSRVESILPMRLLTIPMTDAAARLDRRRPAHEGNSVWAWAIKPRG